MINKIKTTITATDARKDFFKILQSIDRPNRKYTITLGGKAKAVILSADEYDSWLETIEILNNPKIMKEINEAEKEFERGEYIPLEEILREEGFILSDKSQKKYEISRNFKKGSAQKSKKNRRKI